MKNTTFSERLNLAMKEAGVTQGALANAVGMAQPSVWKLVSGGGKGSRKTVQIAQVLGVRPDWLADGIGPMRDDGQQPMALPIEKSDLGIYRVEVMDVSASAGPGTFLVSDFAQSVHAIEFSQEHARSLFGGRQQDIIKMITVDGDSMAPTFLAGDSIFVDVSVRNFETDGVYTFVFGQTFHIKRLQMQGNRLAVISDNSIYRDWYIDDGSEGSFFIMGKVLIHQSIKYNRVG
ncbi:XRE family transcriptional regulator [Enterobacter kobei]|uniref:XRE family transcriptional regulator n=1 Tax=Enterobacter kobei TaxID=208224 RepID=UPI00237852A8|nr:helix-turn-helix transcriptional regulator [Enterobacter kobei]MDD9221541.1 helix-turn-helix transcriptional regulator [Enterobacter kobei]